MKHSKKILSVLSLIIAVGLISAYVTGAAEKTESKAGNIPVGAYAPKQPIDYSHKLHAGELQIECAFCHTYARRSRAAGIPAVEQCMACHMVIAADRDPIKKIAAAYDKKQPIEWVKVHDIPDFVYFSHKRHVKAGFECQECHGEVQEMDVVYREAPLTMGWCVNCHQDNLDKGASVDCLTCHK